MKNPKKNQNPISEREPTYPRSEQKPTRIQDPVKPLNP
jgi:hypothetical protein